VHDDPRIVVEDDRDVLESSQVVLDRRKLTERDRGERGVLAVGAEDPRIVGVAGGKPTSVRDGAEWRGELLALVSPADLQVGCRLGEVGEVLLTPLDRVL
jgi:hypothetical protein